MNEVEMRMLSILQHLIMNEMKWTFTFLVHWNVQLFTGLPHLKQKQVRKNG